MTSLPIPNKVKEQIDAERIAGVYSKDEYDMEWTDDDKNVIDRLNKITDGYTHYERRHHYFSNEEYQTAIKNMETKLTEYRAEYKLLNPAGRDLYYGKKEPSHYLDEYKENHTQDEYCNLVNMYRKITTLNDDIKDLKDNYEYCKNYTPKRVIVFNRYYNDKEYDTFLKNIKTGTKNFEPVINAIMNYKKALDISNASRKNPRRSCYLTIKFYSATDIDINIDWRIYKNGNVFSYTEKEEETKK
jgi:hypothetical protein